MKVKKLIMVNLIFGFMLMTSMVGLNAESIMGSQGSILATKTGDVTEKIKMDYDFSSLKENFIANKDEIKAKLINDKDTINAKLSNDKDEIKVKLSNMFDDVKSFIKENVSVTDINKRLMDNLNNM